MQNATTSAAIATVTSCSGGYLLAHVRRHWTSPAPGWTGALSRMFFAVAIGLALSAGLTVAAAFLPLPGVSWLRIPLLVLTLLGPWVVLWRVLKAQRWRLNKTCSNPAGAQSLLHTWLTVQIAGTMTSSFLPHGYPARAWHDLSSVLAILMGLALLSLPALRRETFKLWTPHADVVIHRASRRVTGAIFALLWLWAYLGPVACPHGRCGAGGSHGSVWALMFSIASAWLTATALMQLGSILRCLDQRSRNPNQPAPCFGSVVRAIRLPAQSA
jgi:hypothetical protein